MRPTTAIGRSCLDAAMPNSEYARVVKYVRDHACDASTSPPEEAGSAELQLTTVRYVVHLSSAASLVQKPVN